MTAIYMDHNSTTPPDPRVTAAMMPYLKLEYGNPSCIHAKGRKAKSAVEQAREHIGDFLGTESNDIIFTSGGTESNNLAIKGACLHSGNKKRHIITSAVEHPSVLGTCRFLEGIGFKLTCLGVDDFGMVEPGSLERTIDGDTALVSIMHANNEVGTIQPVAELAATAKKHGALFHTDAVQSFGKIKTDVEDLGVDLLSVSSHKIYGPKGAGALFVRKGTPLLPSLHGGHQERNLRGGTENVPAIAGFGEAARLAGLEYEDRSGKTRSLSEKLYAGLASRITGVHLNGHPEKRLPGTLNVAFDSADGEMLILNLDLKKVCVLTGSACESGSTQPSHVLTAMGLGENRARASVRFSVGWTNTPEEVKSVVSVTAQIVAKLRRQT